VNNDQNLTPFEKSKALATGGRKPAEGAPSLLQELEKNKGAIQRRMQCGPKEAERLIAVAYDAVQRVPKLLECSPASVVMSVRRAAELRLDLNPVLGQFYLVPRYNSKTRNNEASGEIGYRGFIELALRSGKVSSIRAQAVYDCDVFEHEEGLEPRLVHKPAPDRPEDAKLIACYAIARMTGGVQQHIVLSRQDVEKRRESSQSWQAKLAKRLRETVWDTHPAEMWKKSAIRALAKELPMNVAPLAAQVAIEEELEEAGISLAETAFEALPDDLEETAVEPAPAVEQPRMREPGEEG